MREAELRAKIIELEDEKQHVIDLRSQLLVPLARGLARAVDVQVLAAMCKVWHVEPTVFVLHFQKLEGKGYVLVAEHLMGSSVHASYVLMHNQHAYVVVPQGDVWLRVADVEGSYYYVEGIGTTRSTGGVQCVATAASRRLSQ